MKNREARMKLLSATVLMLALWATGCATGSATKTCVIDSQPEIPAGGELVSERNPPPDSMTGCSFDFQCPAGSCHEGTCSTIPSTENQ